MNNQRNQPDLTLRIVRAVTASLALVFVCSCTSTVYDMRQLDQPVVLNNNPFLISHTATAPKLVKVDTYSAAARLDLMDASVSTTTSTFNTAQLNAFLKIGGEPNGTIRNVTLNTECAWFTLLTPLGNSDVIEATGEVTEIQAPLLRSPLGQVGQSLTSQPALPSTVQK